jgi:gamma-glutamyl-gamma-aminobutyraldehyde dehydrogenase
MTSLAHFEKVAGVIELPGQAVIGGRLEPARFGRTFHNVTPRNGTVINGVTELRCGRCRSRRCRGAARFDDGRWRNLHYCDKKQALFALADLMERDAETLAVLVWINGLDACDRPRPLAA